MKAAQMHRISTSALLLAIPMLAAVMSSNYVVQIVVKFLIKPMRCRLKKYMTSGHLWLLEAHSRLVNAKMDAEVPFQIATLIPT